MTVGATSGGIGEWAPKSALIVVDLQKGIRSYGAPGGRNRSERRLHDHVVTKRTWGAFTQTELDAHLKGLGVTQVVISGVATTAGVESTARQAHEHGLNVTLAADAMTDRSPQAHENSVARIFPKLGETGATKEIIALLDQGPA